MTSEPHDQHACQHAWRFLMHVTHDTRSLHYYACRKCGAQTHTEFSQHHLKELADAIAQEGERAASAAITTDERNAIMTTLLGNVRQAERKNDHGTE